METVISLDKIVKNYYIGSIIVEALRSVDIEIKENEYVAIMGPSGSGFSLAVMVPPMKHSARAIWAPNTKVSMANPINILFFIETSSPERIRIRLSAPGKKLCETRDNDSFCTVFLH